MKIFCICIPCELTEITFVLKIYVTFWFFKYTEPNNTLSEIMSSDLGLDVIEVPYGHTNGYVSTYINM